MVLLILNQVWFKQLEWKSNNLNIIPADNLCMKEGKSHLKYLRCSYILNLTHNMFTKKINYSFKCFNEKDNEYWYSKFFFSVSLGVAVCTRKNLCNY